MMIYHDVLLNYCLARYFGRKSLSCYVRKPFVLIRNTLTLLSSDAIDEQTRLPIMSN